MKFEHLSDGDFEELTYDLLTALGFVNVNWRRGSGRAGASADQGRDIVAQLRQREIDGTEHFETWFIQCKHYESGVPPTALESALTWALAERPSVLLYVVSNFLSNPAKNWLRDYEQNNRAPFRLKLWERKDLERILSSHPTLARKYSLAPAEMESTLHPAHLQYVRRPPQNTLDYLFAFLDGIEPCTRDEIFSDAYHFVIKPRYRKPTHRDETIAELMVDPVSYDAFRRKCYKLAENVAQFFLVEGIVSRALRSAWFFGDVAESAGAIARNRETIEYFTAELKTTRDMTHRTDMEGLIRHLREWIQQGPEQQKGWNGHYRFMCETVLPHSYLEEPILFARWPGNVGVHR
jgi:hypothetical protein